MSYIETIQKFLIEALDFKGISIGKIIDKKDVIYVRQTGSKGFAYAKSFNNINMYQTKIQILLYINNLQTAFNISDKIEWTLENAKDIRIEDKEIINFTKVSGPMDLGFDSTDRKIISLNYTVNFREHEVN